MRTLINQNQGNICASCSSYLHRRRTEEKLYFFSQKHVLQGAKLLQSQQQNGEEKKLSTSARLYLAPAQRWSLSFLLLSSWFQSQQSSSIKLPPVCSTLLRHLAHKSWAVTLEIKVKSNPTLPEWLSLRQPHSSNTRVLEAPAQAPAQAREVISEASLTFLALPLTCVCG